MALEPQLKIFFLHYGINLFPILRSIFWRIKFAPNIFESIANEHMTVIENLVKTFLPNFPTRGTKSETHSKS